MTTEEGQMIANAVRDALSPIISSVEELIRTPKPNINSQPQNNNQNSSTDLSEQEKKEIVNRALINRVKI